MSSLGIEGCSVEEKQLKHEEVCKAHAKVEVFDTAAWEEYVSKLKDRASSKENNNRSLNLDSFQDFTFMFGEELKYSRATPEGLTQENVYIMKSGHVVARLIDFTDLVDVGGASVGIDCVSRFPELYFR